MGKLRLKHAANTVTPATGYSDLYPDASGNWKIKKPDGSIIDIEANNDNIYIAAEALVKGDPLVFTEDGKVRKMVNTMSGSTHAVTGITGTPYIFGNTLNHTQGIVVIANNDASTPANNFVKIALLTSPDQLTTELGDLTVLEGVVIDKAMDKRPIFIKLSSDYFGTAFCVIAQTSSAANCYVYNVEIVDGHMAIVLDNTFEVDAALLDIPKQAIVPVGGSTIDSVFFVALSTGESVDSIILYELSISGETVTEYDPVALSCKVTTWDNVPLKCVLSNLPTQLRVAFNKATDNTIIVSDIEVISSPISFTITENAQTETTDVSVFIKFSSVSYFIISATTSAGTVNNINKSYLYSANDLMDSLISSNSFELSNLLVESRFDSINTRTLINYGINSLTGESVYSVSSGIYLYVLGGPLNLFVSKFNKYSLFSILYEISLIDFINKGIVIDYDADNDNITTRVFNQLNEYINDGVDEGFQFAGFAQSDADEDEYVSCKGVCNYSEAHEDLLPGFMYYMKTDGTLICLQPLFNFIVYAFSFWPAMNTARSVNVFYAIADNKLIQADTKAFVNSNYINNISEILFSLI